MTEREKALMELGESLMRGNHAMGDPAWNMTVSRETVDLLEALRSHRSSKSPLSDTDSLPTSRMFDPIRVRQDRLEALLRNTLHRDQNPATVAEVEGMANEVLELREVVAFLVPIARPTLSSPNPTDEELRVEYLRRRFAQEAP